MLKFAKKLSMEQFITPAGQVDFPEDAGKQEALNRLWTVNLTGFTEQGITGNPWNLTHSADNTWYVNPLTADTTGYHYQPIQWNAFPGRLSYYFGGDGGTNAAGLRLGNQDLLCLADTGRTTDGRSFAELPQIADPCPSDDAEKTSYPYGPYGPRGWQDEYCEWSVERDDTGNIVRIDFTCENPEYWNSLWMVDPRRVLELYRETLDKPRIQLEDLYLREPTTGQPVIDPSTGRAAYNPLNKWNSGPVSTATQGGAMHLTSTPNTLQTEIGLASLATAPREKTGNTDAMKLLCCAQYGQPARNSDPSIGQNINQLVAPRDSQARPSKVTLANPPGLYIQPPDFAGSGYKTPDGTSASEFWTIKRGTQGYKDANGESLPGHYILHATFQVPASKGYTVSDITINGRKIQWAGQVAQTFQMQITGMALPRKEGAPARPCVKQKQVGAQPQPLQLFHADVFNALLNTRVDNPMGVEMNLASNSTLIAPSVKQGQSDIRMVLTVASLPGGGPLPKVSFGPGLSVEVTSVSKATYAVPGNTYPGEVSVLNLRVSVDFTAEVGARGVQVTQHDALGERPAVAFPAALHVAAA